MLVKDLVSKICFEAFEIFDGIHCENHVCFPDKKETWKAYADKKVIMVTASYLEHRIVIGVDG